MKLTHCLFFFKTLSTLNELDFFQLLASRNFLKGKKPILWLLIYAEDILLPEKTIQGIIKEITSNSLRKKNYIPTRSLQRFKGRYVVSLLGCCYGVRYNLRNFRTHGQIMSLICESNQIKFKFLLSRTCGEWVNPAQYGLVVVSSSDGRTLPYGKLEDILSRDSSALNCHSNDDKRAWFSIDLGLWVIPSSYTLRHARGYGRSALRNWLFQVSKDGVNWTTLVSHTDDTSLNEPGSTATWPVDVSTHNETQGWRHIRIQQSGKNASGQTHYLSLSGFEVYGTVTGICEDLGLLYICSLHSGIRNLEQGVYCP